MGQMTAIEWREEYSIGIRAVDHEHRLLIILINEILDQASRQKNANGLSDYLGELHSSVAAHFALEEIEMQQRGYKKFAEHKADHEKLLDDIRDLMDASELPAPLHLDEFSARLAGWFLIHFSSHDALLHRELQAT